MNDRRFIQAELQNIQSYFESKANMAYGGGKMKLLSWARACGGAVELLKEKEPRVLTLEELKQSVDCPCWFESHGTYIGRTGFWIIPYNFPCYGTMLYVFPLMRTDKRGNCHYSELGLGVYNKVWRCWTVRPTKEQRKAVKWE